MKALVYALIVAAVVWMLSEALELGLGGRTSLTLGMTAAFHLLMAPGVWGAYLGQPGPRSALSGVAAGMASLGYAALVYPPIAAARDPSFGITEFLDANPPFAAAAGLATFGVTLFGVAVLRTGSYARWIGVVLLVCPIAFAAVMTLGGPAGAAVAVNVVLAATFLVVGVRALVRME